jgi:hypothetical protein
VFCAIPCDTFGYAFAFLNHSRKPTSAHGAFSGHLCDKRLMVLMARAAPCHPTNLSSLASRAFVARKNCSSSS